MGEIAFSKDPTYRELLQARQRLQPFWDASDRAFLRFREQVAPTQPPGSVASEAQRFETYDEFIDYVRQRAMQDAQAAGVPAEQIDYRVKSAVTKWLNDQRLSEALQFYKAQVISQNPTLMDDLRRWYPDAIAKYLLEVEQKSKVGAR